MDKVIEGLRICSNGQEQSCEQCPYKENIGYCVDLLMHDALEALYKQTTIPIKEGEHYICYVCHAWIISKQFKYCPECGSAIEWNTEMYPGDQYGRV